MKIKNYFLALVTILLCQQAAAVRISDNEEGQALLFPYYSVQNDLNSYLNIENNSDKYKAIKVSVREGFNGYSVLNFNIYLPPHESWTGQFEAVPSTISGHEGQASTALITSNQGCTPYLANPQETLPDEINKDSAINDLVRSQTGFIKVVEMGEVVGNHANAIDNDCVYIENSWWFGEWQINSQIEMQPANGGLSGSMVIENDISGEQLSYAAIAIEDFYDAGLIAHTKPESLAPFYAETNRNQLILNNQPIEHFWVFAHEVSSASFMRDLLSGQFLKNANTDTEVVLTFPTKTVYANFLQDLEPFTQEFQSNGACENVPVSTYDNNGVLEPQVNPQSVSLCRSVNVLGLNHDSYGTLPYLSEEYHNLINIQSEQGTVEFDFSRFATAGAFDFDNNSAQYVYFGLPVIGVVMHKVETGSNTSLTMQEMTNTQRIVTDLIFEDGFKPE
jgi:hypothetical protein